MMDSQEATLTQGASEEQSVEASAAPERKQYASKAEVLERVKEIAHGEENPEKGEVDYLKTVFYKLHIAEREAAQKAYLDGGGDPEAYTVLPDEVEESFKAEMGIIRERRAKLFREQEEEKEANLQRKLDIIEKIKAMATTPEEANQSYQEFKALQAEWKEIKSVPATKASELWRNYQLYVEQYYDLLKLNSEAREYDFKKNLEKKTQLCEAAEQLAAEADVVEAFHKLQQLHTEYRETGPVAKDLREQVWARFKAASTVVNKRHQQHFEEIRAKEEENLAAKTALCEKVEAVAAEECKTATDWERRSQEIIALQTEWKKLGFAPQKMNVKIFERFRAACDGFFTAKAGYFRQLKDAFKENVEKKRALVERAVALKDSTEWKKTADKLIALQAEWKTVGPTPKKVGDQLWEEFRAACNQFFDARKAQGAGQRSEEHANLEGKRGVIARLNELTAESCDNVQETVKALMDEYAQFGHVPYKEKDKLYEEYRAALDRVYKDLNVSTQRKRLSNFKERLKNTAEKGGAAIDGERARLVRQYEALRGEVQTYENNLGFLNASSKKGNSLIEEMKRRVQKLRDEMELLHEKIKAVDSQDK